jgi:hypothetical protein
MTYEKYCEGLERFDQPITMSEEEWSRAYGRAEEFSPMIITPRNQKRPMSATLENHESIKKPKKTVVKKSLTTRQEITPKKPKAVKPYTEPKPPKVKMSEEERALRHREQRQREYARRKAVRVALREERGLEPCVRVCKLEMSTEEKRAWEKEQKRLQAVRYRERIKNDPERLEIKRQRDRENQRKFQEKNRERRARWVEKNPERAKEHYQKWAKSNPEALKEKQRLHKEVRRADPEYRAKEAANARAYRARKRMSCSAEMSCSA